MDEKRGEEMGGEGEETGREVGERRGVRTRGKKKIKKMGVEERSRDGERR